MTILRGNERAQKSLHEWLTEIRTMPSRRAMVITGARRKGAVEKAAARCIVIEGAVGVGKTTLAMNAPREAHFSNVVVFSGPELQADDLVRMRRVVPTFHRVAPAIVVDDADAIPHQMKDSFAETAKGVNYRVPIILVATTSSVAESDHGFLARTLSGNIAVQLFPCNARDAEALLPPRENERDQRRMAAACKGDVRHAAAQTQFGPNAMPDKDFGGSWGERAAATAALSGKRAEGGLQAVVANMASRRGATQLALTSAHDLLSSDDIEISSRISEMSSTIDTFDRIVDPAVNAHIAALELRRHPLRPVVAGQQQRNVASSSSMAGKRTKPENGFAVGDSMQGLSVANEVFTNESKRSRLGWSPFELPASLALHGHCPAS